MLYQFPPSSPLMATHSDDELFKKTQVKPKALEATRTERARAELPTPNPSSLLFRSSSPVRDRTEGSREVGTPTRAPLAGASAATAPAKAPVASAKAQEAPARAQFAKPTTLINTDFNILNPDASVVRVPLVPHKHNVVLGRSSQLCDFFFGSHDKQVLRTHVLVLYNLDHIVMRCLGLNGVAVRIPRACLVYATNTPHNYVVLENKTGVVPHLARTLKRAHKLIRLEAHQTEFALARHETITLPRFANILLQVGQHVILVNPLDVDEELTDDEQTPVRAVHPSTPGTPLARRVVAEIKATNAETPLKKEKKKETVKFDLPETKHDSKPQAPLREQTTNEINTPTVVNKAPNPVPSISEHTVAHPKMNKPAPFVPKARKPVTAVAQEEKENDKENQQPAPAHPNKPKEAPVAAITPKEEVSPAIQGVQVETQATVRSKTPQANPPKRKMPSEEPEKVTKRAKTPSRDSTPAPDPANSTPEEVIDDTDSIPETKNILINHLAFSRLLLTPALFLRTILELTSRLLIHQLRVLLHLVECIGVIYREGKDAAGKPLEEEYYYMPETDLDHERKQLMAQMKGHGGLRACRRTHKQYYWKKPAMK